MCVRKVEGVWRRRGSKERLPNLFLLLAFVLVLAIPVVGDDAAVWLTAEERAWIAAHPVITVAPDPDFPPIEYFDEDGEYQGLAADYLLFSDPLIVLQEVIITRQQVKGTGTLDDLQGMRVAVERGGVGC